MDTSKGTFGITVDNVFIAQAVTVAMQMRGDLGDDEMLEVRDMRLDEDTGYLQLLIERKKVTVN